MSIGCNILGLCLIAMAFYLKPGGVRNGKILCTGKISLINDKNDTVTVCYKCKKEEYFHEIEKRKLNFRYYSKGIKVSMWVDASNPQNIIHIIPGSNDYGVTFRLSLGFGLFFAIAGVLTMLV